MSGRAFPYPVGSVDESGGGRVRQRVRQIWPEEGDAAPGGSPELRERLRDWWAGEEVQVRVGRLALQSALAAALLAACLAVGWIGVPALNPARAWLGRTFGRDYTVSMAWQDAGAWAKEQGGWGRAMGRTYIAVRERLEQWGALLPGASARKASPEHTDPNAAVPGGIGAPGAAQPGPAAAGAVSGGTVPGGADSAAGDPAAPAAPAAESGAGPGSGAAAGAAARTGAPAAGPAAGLIVIGDQPPAGDTGTAADPILRPVPGEVLSPLGWRQRPGAGGPQYHNGVDIPAPVGTPVRAMRSGQVRDVAADAELGPIVALDHGDGQVTRYAPLDRIAVKVGDRVQAGAVLGYLAAAPGGEPGVPHLHLELLANGSVPVDPEPFLARGGGL